MDSSMAHQWGIPPLSCIITLNCWKGAGIHVDFDSINPDNRLT